MSFQLPWISSPSTSSAPSAKGQSALPVTMPSHFTFVESGEPSSGGASSSPGSKNIVRSRAMQSVWAQRGKNQADKNKDAAFVIETADTFDQRAAAKGPPPRRRQSTVPNRKAEGRRVSRAEDPRKQKIASLKNDASTSSNPVNSRKSPEAYRASQTPANSGNDDKEPVIEIERDQSIQREIQEAVEETRRQLFQPMDSMAVGTLDPFQMACIHMDTKSNAYLHHYFKALSWKFTMPKKTWLRLAMENPALLQSVLFVSSAHYGFCQTKTQALTTDARRVAAALLQEITASMQDPIKRTSDATIAAIARLITWSIVQGNKESFAKHSKCIDQLIQLRGGLDSLGFDGQLRYLVCCNTFGAASIWMDAIPESLRYPYGPLEYSALEDVPNFPIQPDSASSFIALRVEGWLPEGLADVCIAMAKIDAVLSRPNIFESNEQHQTAFGHCSNQLALRLMYGTHREARAHQGTMPGVDLMIREVTRTTVLCYLLVFQRDAPIFSLPVTENLRRVKLWIEKCQRTPVIQIQNAWGGGKLGDLLFWILVVNGTLTINPKLKQELAQHVRVVAEVLQINTWKRVQQVCRGFLWQQPMVERKCTVFWNDIFYFPTYGLQNLSLGGPRAVIEEIHSPTQSSQSRRGSDRSIHSQSSRGAPKSATSRISSSATLRESIDMRDDSPEYLIPPLNTEDSTASDGSVTSGASPPMAQRGNPRGQANVRKDGHQAPYSRSGSTSHADLSKLRTPGRGAASTSESRKQTSQPKGRGKRH